MRFIIWMAICMVGFALSLFIHEYMRYAFGIIIACFFLPYRDRMMVEEMWD